MFFIKMYCSWQGLSLIPSQGFGVILIHFNKPADSRLQTVDSVSFGPSYKDKSGLEYVWDDFYMILDD